MIEHDSIKDQLAIFDFLKGRVSTNDHPFAPHHELIKFRFMTTPNTIPQHRQNHRMSSIVEGCDLMDIAFVDTDDDIFQPSVK